jgi:hypothetical protein
MELRLIQELKPTHNGPPRPVANLSTMRDRADPSPTLRTQILRLVRSTPRTGSEVAESPNRDRDQGASRDQEIRSLLEAALKKLGER